MNFRTMRQFLRNFFTVWVEVHMILFKMRKKYKDLSISKGSFGILGGKSSLPQSTPHILLKGSPPTAVEQFFLISLVI